jgi:predicted enzyme related to lactoylglutathione lyase
VSDVLFAGVPVAEFEAAVQWYSDVFGRPADMVVHDREVMWRIAEAAWLYVLEQPAHAGHAIVSIAVPDLTATTASLAGRGIEVARHEVVPGAGRKATFLDPEGNALTFIEVIAAAPS